MRLSEAHIADEEAIASSNEDVGKHFRLSELKIDEDPLSKYPPMYRSLVSGISKMGESAALSPGFGMATAKQFSETVSPVAVSENISKTILGYSPSNQTLPEWVKDNSLAKHLRDASASWSYKQNKYKNEDLISLVNQKRYADAGNYIFHSVVENAPNSMFAFAAAAAGHPEIGMASLGVMQGAQTYQEAREKQLDEFKSVSAGLINGSLEAAWEQAGTFGLMKWGKELFANVGKMPGKAIVKNVLKYTLGSSIGEGNEEFWTQLTQDFTNKVYGVEDIQWRDMPGRALEAGVIGAVSGVTSTAPSGIALGIQEQSRQNKAKKILDDLEKNRDSIEQSGRTRPLGIKGLKEEAPQFNVAITPEQRDKEAIAIGENIRSQIIQAGYTPEEATQYGKLWETSFKAMAERSGITPKELFEKYKPEIRGPEQALIKPGEGMEQSVNTNPELAQKAIDRFGETQNMAMAGFVLPDGRMVDFAEKGDARLYDHRTVAEIYGTRERSSDTERLRDFMGKAGAVRIGNYQSIEGNHFSVEAMGTPTRDQIKQIGDYFDSNKVNKVIFEIVDENGYASRHEAIKNPTGEDVARFFLGQSLFQGPITRLDFKTGEMVSSDELEKRRASEVFKPPVQETPTVESKPIKRNTVAPKAGEVSDVGEQLWYNRRNFTKGLTWDKVKDLNPTLKTREVVKGKVWEKPNYEELVEGGMQPFTAHIVKQIYDSIAAKPSTRGEVTDEQMKIYMDGVAKVRDAVFAWAKDKNSQVAFLEALTKNRGSFISELGSRQGNILDMVFPFGPDKHNRFRSNPAYNEMAILLGGNKLIQALQPAHSEMREAMKAIEEGFPAKREMWQVRFKVREEKRGESASEFYVVRKATGRIMGAGFKTKEEADNFARGLVEKKTSTRQQEREVLDRWDRVGPPRRETGQNVQPQALIDVFGFRGVNYGNWVNDKERQEFTNSAYDALHDLAEVLNIPPKAISLNGLLGLAFGAQGRGGNAAAHFVPGVNEINLTKTAGAGALAHEWGHALDHYFGVKAELAKKDKAYLTHHVEGTKETLGEVRPEIIKAFRDIVSSMKYRLETPEETKARIEKNDKRDMDRLESWIRAIRDRFKTMIPDVTQQSEALKKYDALADRIRKGDVGDGYIQSGRSQWNSIKPVVAEIRDLFRSETGRALDGDYVKGLNSNAEYVSRSMKEETKARLREPIRQPTRLASESMKTDREKGGKEYWNSETELFARSFESYVLDQLSNEARKNDYLTTPQSKENFLYPQGVERDKINSAFDTLVSSIKTKETEQGTALYQPSQTQGEPRGRIQFGADSINIDLLKGADKSTFLHETGHFYLKMLADLSSMENASPDLKADANTILNWLGAKSLDNLSTEQHEKFARGFEAYLMEGKAPTSALAQAFENFKKWLGEIYKTLKNLDVELTDEVRGAMDRLFTAPTKAESSPKLEVILPNEESGMNGIYARAAKLPQPTVMTAVKKASSDTWKNVESGFNAIASSISSRLAAIDISLKYLLRKYEHNVIKNTKEDLAKIKDFIVKSKSMSPEDKIVFDLARKNSDQNKIEELARKYNIDLNEYRTMMNALFKRAKSVGYEVGYIENYHPRKVKDAAGLLAYFKKQQETWSEIEKQTALKEAQLGRILSQEEKAQLINLWVRGYGNKLVLSTPGNFKGRKIDTIDENLNQFYEDSDSALIKYVTGLNEGIESRRFFGKELKFSNIETGEVKSMNVEDTVGLYTAKLIKDGKIKPEQEKDLKRILQARFGYRHSSPLLGLYKNLTYMDTMGSVISAITQLEDVGVSMYKSAVETPGSIVKALMNDSNISMDDIGIDQIWEELRESTKSSTMVRKMFNLTGLSFMDRVGKETLMNTVINDYRKQAKSGDVAELENKIQPIFEGETQSVIEDLKTDKLTDNILYLAFNELLDVQPVALSEMPLKYLESPGGRFFYTLKSFMIKRIDFIRNEALSKMASPDRATKIEGLRNFMKLWFVLGIFGAGPDLLKNLLLNRDWEWPDLIVDNLLKPFGLGKWFLYMARREGIGKALLLNLFPPMKAIDSIYMDITINIPNGEKMEIPASIPLGGKLYYWWLGKGADKKNKKGKKTY